MDCKFGFVILHFMGIDDTVECVNSIIQSCVWGGTQNCEIIIVDNASPNHTGAELQCKYLNEDNIHIILNKNNLGFAKGNNIGYQFAKDELHCDFVACINNDTVLKQENFCSVIENSYEKYGCELVGPDIISIRDGQHQNPLSYQQKPYYIKSLVKSCIHLLLLYFRDFFPRYKEPKKYVLLEKDNKLTFHCKLMGAAIIFTPAYLEKYDYAFNPRTFMYCEEDFLSYLVQRDGLLTVYQPEAVIYHKEFSSTSITFKGKSRKQLRFRRKKMLLSYIQLILQIISDKRNTN